MGLDPTNVHSTLVPLLPMAERWGIGDDIDRDVAVANASVEELRELADCLDDPETGILLEWLTGPESQREPLTKEYCALTCLVMAVQQAKVVLSRR